MFPAPTRTVVPLTEKPTLEAARTAIKTVLSHDPNVDRRQASDWLDSLKGSVFAWEICNQLLLANEGVEVSYLAAHMLRQKISRNFNELPVEYCSSLKDSILNHLQVHEDYAVQGQLTMAIADLTLLLQTWQSPIEDLAKQLGLDVGLMSIDANDQATIYKALHNRLIFAYILSQMCDLNHNHSERPCKITAKRREEFEDYLISKCSQAITWWLSTLKEISELQSRMNTFNLGSSPVDLTTRTTNAKIMMMIEKLVGQIYLCYSAWLRIFDEENVNESLPLIDAAFKHLNDINCPPTIHKYAVEVVKATAMYCEDNRAVDYLVGHLVTQIYVLEQAFRQSVTLEDTERSSNFAKTFTSVAETACLTHVIENRDFKLVELLLSCLSHYDFEIVEETYQFWWMFLENLQNRLKQADYGPFIPYMNRFVMSVTKLCQFDPDEDSVISTDQDIHAFRANSAEIITNVMYVTTVGDFLRDNQVLEHLKIDLSKISWEKTEAILYLLSCLVMLMDKDDNHLRMQIFNGIIIQQTNQTDIQTLLNTKQVPLKIGVASGEVHPQIVATSLKIIGSLDSFFVDNPDYLALAINYILTSISHPSYQKQLIKFAATALCNIMEQNAQRYFSSCPELLMIVKNLCTMLDQFDEQAAQELLKCSAYMAGAIQDNNLKDQFLCEITKPNLNSLKNTLNSTERDEHAPTKYLDRLSVVFRQASIHPAVVPELKNFIALIDTELWPILVKVLEVYASANGHAIERACRTIRYTIRCIKPEWMIPRVAETMVNLYKTYPQNSSPLYICSILVDEFANRSPEINQGLFNMLEIFCQLTFTLLEMSASQSKSLLTMKNYPETIDDMMRLFYRFLEKCPADFVNCKALESIIELSISSIRIDHHDANANVTRFACAFISLGARGEFPHITEAIRNVLGARFTDAVIKACIFDLPSSLIGESAQILSTLYSFDKDLFYTWVEASASTLPKTNIQGVESVTTEQIEDFKRTITTVGTLKRIVNCLRALARLYI